MADDYVFQNYVKKNDHDVTESFPEEDRFRSANGLFLRAKEQNIYYLLQAAQTRGSVYNHKLQDHGIVGMVVSRQYREHFAPIKTNKIFCSDWLSEKTVAIGTKCNKLLVYDVFSYESVQIPSLKGSGDCLPLSNSCGIHGLAVNPSQTMLATGGEQSNILAIYSLPTFDPLCSGDEAHEDWIFDIKWLDDEFLVSGSRDNTIALWKVPTESKGSCSNTKNPYYSFIKPKVVRVCNIAKKVRALAFRPDYELAAVSLNGHLHSFDLKTFQQKGTQKLPFRVDSICLEYHNERNVYIVGTQGNVTFLNCESMKTVSHIDVPSRHFGIRSLRLRGNILSVGTATGFILFSDIRVGKWVGGLACSARNFSLFEENSALSYLTCPTLFTHSYDSSGTRIFAGGGPLTVDLFGCYAAVWQ